MSLVRSQLLVPIGYGPEAEESRRVPAKHVEASASLAGVSKLPDLESQDQLFLKDDCQRIVLLKASNTDYGDTVLDCTERSPKRCR
jgi:hypothetical protein